MKHFTVWMQEAHNPITHLTRPLKLKDGTTLSIQASRSHYCSPRGNHPYHEYTTFEIGFPSSYIKKLAPYGEEQDDGESVNDIYVRVPSYVIEEIINDCGGVVGYKDKQ